jgi:hypothetical protein
MAAGLVDFSSPHEMKILGQAQIATGERSRRHSIPGWQRLRNGWQKISNSKSQISVPLSAGATPLTQMAVTAAQRAMPQATVNVGIENLPVSVSFPDGKAHPRPMR